MFSLNQSLQLFQLEKIIHIGDQSMKTRLLH